MTGLSSNPQVELVPHVANDQKGEPRTAKENQEKLLADWKIARDAINQGIRTTLQLSIAAVKVLLDMKHLLSIKTEKDLHRRGETRDASNLYWRNFR